MSTAQDEPNRPEELASSPDERTTAEEPRNSQTPIRHRKGSRQKILTGGLGVAAAAVGAGALVELSSGTTQASSTKAGVFASSTAGTPAVSATGTNGADGVDASSDSGTGISAKSSSGTGISAKSSSGTGLLATSSSGLAGHFTGNVTMDNNLNVAGGLSTGTLSSGSGTFASSVTSTPAVTASSTNAADGVYASSDDGIGIRGESGNVGILGHSSGSGVGVQGTSSSITGSGASGTGVRGISTSGDGVYGSSGSNASTIAGIHGFNTNGALAGLFDGDVTVNGNFNVQNGTKNFVQAHPTDPSREIVYVALEGGEARTYVCGTGQLQSGKAVIALPEHFALVTATEGLAVQLTPRGQWLQLYVVELDTASSSCGKPRARAGRSTMSSTACAAATNSTR